MVNHEYFTSGRKNGIDYLSCNCIAEENLQEFFSSSNFLPVVNQLKRDESVDHEEATRDAVSRMNACQMRLINASVTHSQ